MANKHYHVIADFVDKETGETIPAGALFEADNERLVLLRAAEVIGKEATKEEINAANEAGKGDTDEAGEGDADDGKTG